MELLLGILTAWGLIMLLWTLMGALFMPLQRREETSITVILRGDGRFFCSYLKGLLWLRDMGIVWWNILIIQDELSADTIEYLTYFVEKKQHVSLISKDALQDWMEQ